MSFTTDTGLAPNGPSSDANHSPSADVETLEVQNKALRQKITEMGETNKDLLARLSSIEANQQRMQQAPAQAPQNPPAPNLDELATRVLDADATPDEARAALVALVKEAASLGEQRATRAVDAQYGRDIEYSREAALSSAATEYFADKGVPDLAQHSSRFWTHVQTPGNMTPVMAAALQSKDFTTFFDLGMRSYSEKFGDPVDNRGIAAATREKAEAGLMDGPSAPVVLPSKLEKFIANSDPSDPEFMQKMDTAIKDSGIDPEKVTELLNG